MANYKLRFLDRKYFNGKQIFEIIYFVLIGSKSLTFP